MMGPLQGYDGGHWGHGGLEDQETIEGTRSKMNGGDSGNLNIEGLQMVTKVKPTSELASMKHALSERKRRKRINCHYDSLRQFFPRLLKTDKASVLTETVRRLKELRIMVDDVTPSHGDVEQCSGSRTPRFFLPSVNDELTISYCDDGNKTAVRAIVCCEDRPGLNRDLTGAIQSVRGKAVRAEMATVGGRTKAEVVVEWLERGGGGEEDVEMLRRALKAVVENRVLGCTGLMGYTDPEMFGLGRRFVEIGRPKEYDPFENRIAEGLILRSC